MRNIYIYIYTTDYIDTEENGKTKNANLYSAAKQNKILPPVRERQFDHTQKFFV